VLISMEPPTRPMREEAADTGSYGEPWGQEYPRMQLARKVAKDRVISTVDFEARHRHRVRLRFVTANAEEGASPLSPRRGKVG
jgi:hypothetical protein